MNGVYSTGGGYATAIGYPWWVERIDTRPSTCFIEGPYTRPSCEFINYSDIFYALAVIAAVGAIVWLRSSKSRRHLFVDRMRRAQEMLGLNALGDGRDSSSEARAAAQARTPGAGWPQMRAPPEGGTPVPWPPRLGPLTRPVPARFK